MPFFNLSPERTADGRQFAVAYAAELQTVPGFEVLPVGVVEAKIQQYQVHFTGKSGAEAARKLAQLLEVDAVVIGAITDFSPYYPPRVGLSIEWYAANPGFHPIPAGYGLPWGTTGEEEIPDALIFEAERSLAIEQLKTQTPPYEVPELLPPPEAQPPADPRDAEQPDSGQPREQQSRRGRSDVRLIAHEEITQNTAAKKISQQPAVGESIAAGQEVDAAGNPATALPPDWPDPRGFSPPTPSSCRPPLRETNLPVLKHVRLYNGTDAQVTTALQSYVYFRDDARFGGWQSYLQRSDDFIRFCCHMHIAEMLTARGGAGQTRVVWRWPTGR
ncbi:MAG: hypothetical protein K8U03_24575 [Planctomycetia bacterium]|nr:hypothetical protein [Planctomycetia bacterium]